MVAFDNTDDADWWVLKCDTARKSTLRIAGKRVRSPTVFLAPTRFVFRKFALLRECEIRRLIFPGPPLQRWRTEIPSPRRRKRGSPPFAAFAS